MRMQMQMRMRMPIRAPTEARMAELAALLPTPHLFTLLALLAVIATSLWLGRLAQRAIEKSSFVRGFFLGNRSLRSWAMALTATVQSGGTFMGYPSLVFTHGWIVGLWIGAYMVIPITAFGVLAKRFAQLSRRTGAITVPDLFRERFQSPALGLLTSLLILLFLLFMMVAQFKAGAIVLKFAWLGSDTPAAGAGAEYDFMYYVGLAVFTATVLAYTLMGGFLASVWTDLFQSVLMLAGVIVLFFLAVPAAGGMEAASRTAAERAEDSFVFGPGLKESGAPYLPLGIAISMFCVWTFGGMGSSASLVRVMASSDAPTLRRSIVILSLYNLGIYIPLMVICVAARAVLPEGGKSDEVVPRMALWTTQGSPAGPLVAGLVLAAPFGAVMATVSSYLVVIASGLVRDVYQRWLARDSSDATVRRLAHVTMLAIGAFAVAANVRPVNFLQSLIVFGSTGQAAAFFVPAMMAAYWRRATAAGVLAAMLAGALTVLALLVAGIARGSLQRFEPYALFGFDPVVWGLLASALAGILVSLWTRPPDAKTVERLFGART
jgi:SSS family solute:Na+ symporter/sodium/pantothenate symporter